MKKTQQNDITKLFGSNVKKYRNKCGLTQEELSEKLEISQKHLSSIETGVQFVSANLLSKIITILNVSPAALFEYDISEKQIESVYAVISGTLYEHIDSQLDFLYERIKKDILEINGKN